MNCRHCQAQLQHSFLDLGYAPPSNAYLTAAALSRPERYYPLRLWVCEQCWLVQTEDYADAGELFDADYAYFSSTSSSWLAHARTYVERMREALALGASSLVIEVASNDGYLLRNFVEAGVPCLGVEPTASTADAAERLGIPVLREFFGEALGQRLAEEGRQADLLLGNNVFAHVPDINDFSRGLKAALKPGGTLTLEFPHLLRLIELVQFDTVYHEHFSYLSLYSVQRILDVAGLRIHDVEELNTHGGSLRIHASHQDDARPSSAAVDAVLRAEQQAGLRDMATYQGFQARADRLKDDLLGFLLEQKRAGQRVAAYGAAAKGNTILNYAGIKPDLLPCVFDAAPSKQGRYLPGSHVPIRSAQELDEVRPDLLLILPWNITDEVMAQNQRIREWGGRFVTAVPRLEVK
ncbi:SAM-dependent methyltransferase [Pseudomonas sp. PA15(2017)]|uniref:class I SAM-dependent methyltransferase n=1 Tax=Pseudomonas sp. PA15(2017) TaxID=1932111 RepID=UPI000969B9C3|nr:class I SAM-dependent methyltransferase [Pseudomonas sp. PA15(2017)]OLU32686.1 SAM-dependent methyltransferase [Pseudomonas sp. PA15(2017)]